MTVASQSSSPAILLMPVKVRTRADLGWTLYFLAYFVCLTSILGLVASEDEEAKLCPFPTVPYAATYVNVTGGPDQSSWKIKYVCDSGYELFGEDVRQCENGVWQILDDDEAPHCAVNVALHKPAQASSVVGEGAAVNAVDGSRNTVHEGSKCTETKSEKSPWWTVDLLQAYPVNHVRLTTRCCDDVPIKKAEIRVGNSTEPGNNQLCNWIPKALDEGTSETLDCYEALVGRYVSIVMTGVETVLSLCEVEVFSTAEISLSSCSSRIPPDELSVFQGECYHFVPGEVSGFDEAKGACTENELHLISDLNDNSQSFFTSRLDQRLKSSASATGLMAWLGAERDSGQGQEKWSWVTGNPVDSIDWGRGQPNNYNQEQNCAVLDSELDWRWNDISCRISAVVVCQGSPTRCPSPPVGQGSFYSGDLKVGDTLTYQCPVGEMPVGNPNTTCTEKGQWTGQPITCKKVDCGQVPGLANGEIHVLDGRTTWGARVQYKCKDNYSLMEGKETRVCEEKGWTGKAPICVYAKCAEPSPVDNASVKRVGSEENPIGTKLTYSCEQGYKASGSLSRECQIGGKWSGSPPKCEFVDCGDPPQLEHGSYSLLDGRTTFNAAVEYSCGLDYRLVSLGRPRRTCEANKQWSRSAIACEVIQCPPPRAPSGGRVSGYDRDVHSKIEFSCLTGHILEGQETLTCTRDATWSHPTPICRFVDCGSPEKVDGGTIHYVNGSTHLGSMVRYSCDRSYDLEGQVERVCQEDGRWSGEDPSCSEIRCSLPARPNNTIVSVSSTERLHGTSVIRSKISMKATYRVGSTLKYRCERGYILETESGPERVMTRRCTTSGTWTGSDPQCTFVDCGAPERPENSKVSLPNSGGTYYGSVAFYQCDDHFKLDGFEKRRCEADGKWKPEAPNCTETLCKPLSQPSNGQMVLTTLRIGGKATFTCDQGFALKGDHDLECLSSGSWSSWPPNCVEIDCGQPDKVENGRVFLVNRTTTMSSIVEYHCFPGYDRDGPFQRVCGEDGYWSGVEPSCSKPRPVLDIIAKDNTIDGTKNVRAGPATNPEDTSSVGTWIGVALGLIVVIGLLVLGLYFYRKKRALATKPPPYRDSRGPSVANNGEYIMSSVYSGVSSNGSNGSTANGNGKQAPGPRIGQRPPPPIQMYGLDDSGNDDHRGPIYDTINDDSGSGSAYSRSQSGSDKGGPAPYPTTPSTFGVTPNGSNNGYHHPRTNGGYSHDYDVPEGSEQHQSGSSRNSVGAVTINGIAV